MNCCLLPFPTRKLQSSDGLPDIRHQLQTSRRQTPGSGLDCLELLNHTVAALCEQPWRMLVDHCHWNSGRLHLAVIAWDLGRNLEVGDQVNAGFFLSHSEIGDTLACSRIFRVACENGALVECDASQSFTIAHGKSPPANWQARVTEVVQRSFAGEGLDTDLARFRATTTQMVVAPYEFLCHLAAQNLITDDEQCDIQAAFDDAGDYSMYGLINAVTQVAHRHRADNRWLRAFEVERLGGEILRGDHHLPALEPAWSR